MNAITLTPSDCEAVPVCPLHSDELARQCRRDQPDGTEALIPWYSRDHNGIVRCVYGIPQTVPGFVSPLGPLNLHENTPAVMAGVHIALGLAAAAWGFVAGEMTTAGRDVVICLVEEACPIHDSTLSETLCIAEHELQPARDRVAERMDKEPSFAAEFAEARAMMNAGCGFFPWYEGDGFIPG